MFCDLSLIHEKLINPGLAENDSFYNSNKYLPKIKGCFENYRV